MIDEKSAALQNNPSNTLNEALGKIISMQERLEPWLDKAVADPMDVASYYKRILALIAARKPEIAKEILSKLVIEALDESGDLHFRGKKSNIPLYVKDYPSYMNGWILLAMIDTNYGSTNQSYFERAQEYVKQFMSPDGNMAYTDLAHTQVDVISLAHMIRIQLAHKIEKNNKIAAKLGHTLIKLYQSQYRADEPFPLRFIYNATEETFKPTKLPDNTVNPKKEAHHFYQYTPGKINNLMFMPAYAAWALILLSNRTEQPTYAGYAKKFIDLALTSGDATCSKMSHKLALALAAFIHHQTKQNQTNDLSYYSQQLSAIVTHFNTCIYKDDYAPAQDESTFDQEQRDEWICWLAAIKEHITHTLGALIQQKTVSEVESPAP